MKEEKILTEITETCEHCNFSNRCLEENCTLWRIEQIVVNQQEDASEMSKKID